MARLARPYVTLSERVIFIATTVLALIAFLRGLVT